MASDQSQREQKVADAVTATFRSSWTGLRDQLVLTAELDPADSVLSFPVHATVPRYCVPQVLCAVQTRPGRLSRFGDVFYGLWASWSDAAVDAANVRFAGGPTDLGRAALTNRAHLPAAVNELPFPVSAVQFHDVYWTFADDVPAGLRTYAIWGFLDRPLVNAVAAANAVWMGPARAYIRDGLVWPASVPLPDDQQRFAFRCHLPELGIGGRRSARRIVAFWRERRGRKRKSRRMYDVHVDVRWRPPQGVDYVRWLAVEMPEADRELAARSQ
jgi:hypothetical protein